MNKKGYVGDVITWAVALAVLIFMVMIVGRVISVNNDNVQESNTIPEPAKEIFDHTDRHWASGWDNAIALFVGLLFIITFTLAWNIGTNPALFWISLIVLVVCLSSLVALNNALYTFFNADEFLVMKANMPFTAFLVDHFMIVMVGGGCILLLVLFAKMRTEL